jgi:hypothetical protein
MRHRAQGIRRKGKTNDIFFLSFGLEPYALSRGIEERSKATLLARSRLGGEMMP